MNRYFKITKFVQLISGKLIRVPLNLISSQITFNLIDPSQIEQ